MEEDKAQGKARASSRSPSFFDNKSWMIARTVMISKPFAIEAIDAPEVAKEIKSFCRSIRRMPELRDYSARYPLPGLMLGTFLGISCGCQSLKQLHTWMEENVEALRKFEPLYLGVPSYNGYIMIVKGLDDECVGLGIRFLSILKGVMKQLR
ncbi:MAG: transposase family protein [Clostridiales bacterium]|jgi:hypothetical protein|nr:transposase family protein [Clostridiales bacterium]MDR2751888.1 transposase family protein [Clostridiales bacterium]